jgi:DNA polymerase-3 subunit beta
VKVNVKALRGALKAINQVVEKRNTIPILSHVLIDATPGAMTLIATDLDLQIARTIALEEPGKGKALSICVDAGTLASIAGKLPAEGIAEIVLKDGKIIVSCGRARFNLPTLPGADLPLIAHDGNWPHQWEQEPGELSMMLHRVAFAAGTEDTRYYLTGVYLHVPSDSECLFAAATDGHRLARHHVDTPEGADELAGIILPSKAVKALQSLMEEGSARVDIAMSDTKFRFDLGDAVLIGKAIDGTFPDYTRVIPAGNSIAAWFEPGPLIEAVERVLTISSEKTRLIALDFRADKLVLDVVSAENGTASEEVPIDLTGAPVRIGFNGRYLLDVLGQLKGMSGDGGKVRALLGGPADPSLWQASDESRSAYVLMPMRI